MKSSDEESCHVAPPPHSSLRSGPIRSRRVTFSQDRWFREEEQHSGGGQTVMTPPVQPQSCRELDLPSDLNVTQRSQEVDVPAVQLLQGGGACTRSDTGSGSLESNRTSPRGVGVSELSAVLGGLLQLVEQRWNGPGSLQRDQRFLGGAYDLLSELLQPAGGGGAQDEGGAGLRLTSQGSELVLLRRKLEKTEHLLERMRGRLEATLKENYELKRRRHFREPPPHPPNPS